MITFVLIGLAMLAKDLLGTLTVGCINHGRGALAGAFDVLGDMAQVLSIGVTGVVTVQSGLSQRTALAFVALGAGSMAGTVWGVRLGAWLERHLAGPALPTAPVSPSVDLNTNPHWRRP
ncbi:MAG: hypothetical protein ACRDF8_08125 [Chloroflexota bacterium]